MVAEAETAKIKGPTGFFVLACIVHAFDILTRYGTTPFTIGTNPGNPIMWVVFFFFYSILWLIASKDESLKQLGQKTLLVCGIIAYIWGPLWSIIPGYLPALKYVSALMLLIAPFWILVILFGTGAFPRLSLVYSIIWLGIITFALFPQIQTYSEEHGYPLPNALNPKLVLQYGTEKTIEAAKNAYAYLTGIQKKAVGEVERAIKMASGDYYTGEVDQGAKKKLGVYLENFRTAEKTFYTNAPVIAYATMKAETLERELPIHIACDTDKGISASSIRPKDSFTVLTTDQYDIDCIWNPGTLNAGFHNLRLMAEFEFSTRAYLKTYMMDRDRLREYRKQNKDPLENIPDKNPIAVYTSGPVRIGMGIGQQPIAVGSAGESLPSIGITLENAWEGKIIDIMGVFFIVPEGISIPHIEGVDIVQSSCNALPEEERTACDDNLVNVYSLTPDELKKESYKNLTIKTFRIPLEITSPEKVLGNAPMSVQNFKASVQYRYLIERTTPAIIKEVQPTE
ncbi:MAG: hypothetical protein QXR48_00620 [Candidatus Woesearchaeota archaeon]